MKFFLSTHITQFYSIQLRLKGVRVTADATA